MSIWKEDLMGLDLFSYLESSSYMPRSSLKNTVVVGLILTAGMAVRGKKRLHEETVYFSF